MLKKISLMCLFAMSFIMYSVDYVKAAQVNITGVWDFNFEFSNMFFDQNDQNDSFKPKQRWRNQIEIIASENLKGVLSLEIGDTNWGVAAEGGAMGTDGIDVGVLHSFLEFKIPETSIVMRMGLQPFLLPGLVAGSAILDDDAAGIILSQNFTDSVSGTLFWLRASNNNWDSVNQRSNALDLFGISLPVMADNWQITPWGMFGMAGSHSLWSLEEQEQVPVNSDMTTGLLPLGGDEISGRRSNKGWWLGITGQITAFNNLNLAMDAVYGQINWEEQEGFDLKRAGWLVSGLMEYKLDYMTPGLIFWYASGDDSNNLNGSERLPTISPSWQATTFGFDGGFGIAADGAAIGLTPTGTWGIVLRLADISWLEKLSHTLSLGYYRGTNSQDMPAKAGLAHVQSHYSVAGGATIGSTYLTTKDSAWEVNFDSNYELYENLTLNVETGYIKLNLNRGVWGSTLDYTRNNAWRVGFNLQYRY